MLPSRLGRVNPSPRVTSEMGNPMLWDGVKYSADGIQLDTHSCQLVFRNAVGNDEKMHIASVTSVALTKTPGPDAPQSSSARCSFQIFRWVE